MSSRARLRSAAALALLCVAPARAAAQLAPPSTGGIVELDRQLQQLAETRRVLVIGAHPDDEDTELLTLVALGRGAAAAYLSLSRGEGGQNILGPELGPALGLLRSQELLAARALDGAQQFFTRAYDFGYSRSVDETWTLWPPDSLLKDVVRVVRRFRPHVIVSVWSGTERDGHGQHHASGIVARRAFAAAGDPRQFPELSREEGLAPWQPLKLYQSWRPDTSSALLRLETGALEPRTGRSYHQIAMASRSLHRSQDMGQLQRIGPQDATAQLMEDRTGAGAGAGAADLFAGIPPDTSWLTRLADSLRTALAPARLWETATELARAVRRAEPAARARLGQALAVAGGLVMDAVASDDEVVPGQDVEVAVDVFNGGRSEIVLDSVRFSAPGGWRVQPLDSMAARLRPGALARRRFRITVAPDARPTQPYFLERPRQGALYDWSNAPPAVRGEPFQPPVLAAAVHLSLLDSPIVLSREVTYRYNDQASGEHRRAVRVVPAIDVRLEPGLLVWPGAETSPRTITVTLVSNRPDTVSGEVELAVDGWPPPAAQRFTLARLREGQAFTFALRRPPVSETVASVRAIARDARGPAYDAGVRLVDYPHIRPTPWVQPARGVVRVAPIEVPRLARVGYVRGAGDRVPEALRQIGVPLELLGGEDLARGDLARYHAIVIGSRAYETDSALVRHNGRLLEYVRGGGLMIVQYQQYAFVRGGYAAHAITIGMPHDRVTDETAPVRALQPDHPAFTRPNRIGPRDWEGWPQERGLYFARTWDPAYTPLVETNDPGRPPLQGGLLVARYGLGVYVYTGLAFFRALPEGVPGAYRLFLNLLALSRR